MTRKDACQHLRCGVDPVVDFQAIRAVKAILGAIDL
jgi:hypothetical protein